ncbi:MULTISPECIES: F0F1 ATP synthase subunit epsilon [Crateriforma]|uniref:ATP synthase epsilon chain n=1 Tax=Crateriforma conspicua TaxID=2527996 RepID=A0A5C6FQV1_9PLAN|nr:MULTISPECIES: F0F1 ATP synthase subunit epsilon [Crateriforma]QDV65078.1 ATP synthase epsilon chain, sodium ion specific [Crateriforma conspicua]TWT70475.1 ATP synthase epsilon chain, sodium ion specific [Crateriforma conspicua]TWU65542.1 ATP synthase epsilon chain, sodium ion specific [Crateriforma conspicua]
MAIRCIVVTPERTELDREADFVALPMFDGELGVQSGRAPMIGRLGHGVLRMQTNAGPERYFVDGGFAQVEGDVVNVLTSRAISVDLLDGEEAQKNLDEALEMPSLSPEQIQIKEAAVRRARGMLRASR